MHLGTAILERRHQARRLATIVSDRHVNGPKIVLGDFNEWMRGLTTTLLSAKLKSIDLPDYLKRRRTYPGLFPILHLDHIYYAGASEIVGCRAVRTRLVARRVGSSAARRRRADPSSRTSGPVASDRPERDLY